MVKNIFAIKNIYLCGYRMNKIQQLYKEWKTLQPLNEKLERHIQKLKTEGIIERIGGDKGGYWRIM